MKVKRILLGLSTVMVTINVIPEYVSAMQIQSQKPVVHPNITMIDSLVSDTEKKFPNGTKDNKRYPISFTGIQKTNEVIRKLKESDASQSQYNPDKDTIQTFLTTYIVAKRIMNNPKACLTPTGVTPTEMYVAEKGVNDDDNKFTVKTNVRYNTKTRTLSGIQGHDGYVNGKRQFIIDNEEKISVDDMMSAFRRLRKYIGTYKTPAVNKAGMGQNSGKLFIQAVPVGKSHEIVRMLFVKALDANGNEITYATNSPDFPDQQQITQAFLRLKNMGHVPPVSPEAGKPNDKLEEMNGNKVNFEMTDRTTNLFGKDFKVVKITKILQ